MDEKPLEGRKQSLWQCYECLPKSSFLMESAGKLVSLAIGDLEDLVEPAEGDGPGPLILLFSLISGRILPEVSI